MKERGLHRALIHGYEAISPGDPELLDGLYEELRRILYRDRTDFEKDLRLAWFPDFSRSARSNAL